MNKFKFSPLKIGGLIVAGIGFLIAQEIQRRETEEFVEKVIADREEARLTVSNND